jgi:hypothetical protein
MARLELVLNEVKAVPKAPAKPKTEKKTPAAAAATTEATNA